MSFAQWMSEQDGRHAEPAEPPLAVRLEARGLDLLMDGTINGRCCVCERRISLTMLGLTTEECLEAGGWDLHCGGSLRCCP